MEPKELINKYLELNKEKDEVEMQQNIIKDVLKTKMEKDKLDKISSEIGEVTMCRQTRKNFMQESAKKFLTEEQINQCYKETELNFVKIMSFETKSKMRF
jgi:hypothetical protein